MRGALLWASQNQTLRTRLPRYRFVRRAVRKFMPGETVDDALDAAKAFAARGLPTTFTHLGENVTTEEEADAVARHYLDVLERVAAQGVDTEISVKLTHLGLDFDAELATANTERLAERARGLGNGVWIDMEASPYAEPTVEIYRRLRQNFANLGICLQAYLRRTPYDVETLLGGGGIRLVKGAYREPGHLVVGGKRAVDQAYFELAGKLLLHRREGGLRVALATHDLALLERIEAAAGRSGVRREDYEIQMLYGIRQSDQFDLLRRGYRVRSLIAYGSAWYPWYLRRLAEKPTNLLFVARNLFGPAPVGRA
jgi:proline dehydrogenase